MRGGLNSGKYGIKFIYFEKIKKKLNDLKDDDLFAEIHYITIIVAGNYISGKSTLINAVLKDNMAKTDNAQICTIKNEIYHTEKMPFFKMIDTIGIQLIKKYGYEFHFKTLREICNNPNKALGNYFSYFKSKSYKDDIQCIWYCVSEYTPLNDQDITHR